MRRGWCFGGRADFAELTAGPLSVLVLGAGGILLARTFKSVFVAPLAVVALLAAAVGAHLALALQPTTRRVLRVSGGFGGRRASGAGGSP